MIWAVPGEVYEHSCGDKFLVLMNGLFMIDVKLVCGKRGREEEGKRGRGEEGRRGGGEEGRRGGGEEGRRGGGVNVVINFVTVA